MTTTRHTATYATEYANDVTGVEYQTADAEQGTWARVTVNGTIVAGPERNTSEMLRAYQREIRKAQQANDNGSRFCFDCGQQFATTALLDAHQDDAGHEKDA